MPSCSVPVPDVPPSSSHWGRLFCRIQHLGAEIHLIRDMMDPIHTGGLFDFLLTALEVRDRNALATEAGPFASSAIILGMSAPTFTMCVPVWEGSSQSPGAALVEWGRGGVATVHLIPGDPRPLSVF